MGSDGVRLALVAAMLVFFSSETLAGPNAWLIKRGAAIAKLNCARCHAVGAKGESRDARAPPFRTLSKRYRLDGLEEAMAEGIIVGHQGLQMPHFQMTPGQIDAFSAYLRAVQKK